MDDNQHWLSRHSEAVKGYGSVTVSVAGVAIGSAPVPHTDETHFMDVDAFGRLLAAADMADREAGGTDITDLSDDEYLRRLTG